MPSYIEKVVTDAFNALVDVEYTSVLRATLVFQVFASTLQDRVRKRNSRNEGYVSRQILTPIEESTLENWIYRATKLGSLITLQLVNL